MRCVDVEKQQTVGIVRLQCFRTDLRDSHSFRQRRGFERTPFQSTANRRRAGARVYGAERFVPASGLRDHEVRVKARHVFEKRSTQERHIAGHHQRPFARRRGDRRVDASERTVIGKLVANSLDVGAGVVVAEGRGHGEHRGRHQAQYRELAIDDARAADQERGLSHASQAGGAAAGEDRRGQRLTVHRATIYQLIP